MSETRLQTLETETRPRLWKIVSLDTTPLLHTVPFFMLNVNEGSRLWTPTCPTRPGNRTQVYRIREGCSNHNNVIAGQEFGPLVILICWSVTFCLLIRRATRWWQTCNKVWRSPSTTCRRFCKARSMEVPLIKFTVQLWIVCSDPCTIVAFAQLHQPFCFYCLFLQVFMVMCSESPHQLKWRGGTLTKFAARKQNQLLLFVVMWATITTQRQVNLTPCYQENCSHQPSSP